VGASTFQISREDRLKYRWYDSGDKAMNSVSEEDSEDKERTRGSRG
jgi:hypothetical protein